MKLTKDYLKKIINEELKKVLLEGPDASGGAGVVNADPSTVGRGAVSAGPRPKKGNLPPIIITKFFPDPSKITNRDKMLEGLGFKRGAIASQYSDCGSDMLQVKKGCRGLGVLKLQCFLKTAQNALGAKGVSITDPAVDAVFGPETEKAYSEVMDRMKEVYIPTYRGSPQIMRCAKSPNAGQCTRAYFMYLDEELKGKDSDFDSKQYEKELDDRLQKILPDLKLLVDPGCVVKSDGRIKCSSGARFINPYDSNP